MGHTLAVVFVASTAVITAALTVLAFTAARRTGRSSLMFLMGAFGLLTVKAVVTAWALATDSIGHNTLEMLGAGLDLAAVALLIAPFLRR